MRISEDLAFLGGCISSDGHITIQKPPRIEWTATVEKDWAQFVHKVAERAGIPSVIHGPYSGNLYHVMARSTIQAYGILKPASEYIMPRKWQLLHNYYEFGRLEQAELHVVAYGEVMRLIAKGMVRAQACAKVKEQYGIKGNTVQFWVYNGQKPRLLQEAS